MTGLNTSAKNAAGNTSSTAHRLSVRDGDCVAEVKDVVAADAPRIPAIDNQNLIPPIEMAEDYSSGEESEIDAR